MTPDGLLCLFYVTPVANFRNLEIFCQPSLLSSGAVSWGRLLMVLQSPIKHKESSDSDKVTLFEHDAENDRREGRLGGSAG